MHRGYHGTACKMVTVIKSSSRGEGGPLRHLESISDPLNVIALQKNRSNLAPGGHTSTKVNTQIPAQQKQIPRAQHISRDMEYSFDKALRLEDAPPCLVELFELHDHIPQAIVIILGANSIGATSKAQMRAACRRYDNGLCRMLWDQACPNPKMQIGLFVSLVPPCLWYSGFLDQRAAREARRSLNSHIGKICKLLKATVIPAPAPLG